MSNEARYPSSSDDFSDVTAAWYLGADYLFTYNTVVRNSWLSTVKIRSVVLVMVMPLALLCMQSCSSHNLNGPGPSSWRFAAALHSNDFTAAAAETNNPPLARTALEKVFTGLQATGVTIKIGQVHTEGILSTVDYQYQWDLPKNAHLSYRGVFHYVYHDRRWQMRWSNKDIYPDLGEEQNLVYSTIIPAPGALHSFTGTQIIVPSVDKRVEFRAMEVGDTESAVGICQQLSEIFGKYNDHLSPEAMYNASIDNGMAIVAQLPVKEMRKIPHYADVEALPGVKIRDIASWHSVDPSFAPSVAADLAKYATEHQIGAAGWSVRIVDSNGNEVRMIEYHGPQDDAAVTVTLHSDIQYAAQRAVNKVKNNSAIMIAIQPSTGNIVAIAQNSRANKHGMLATMGLYPPGSTFKIITASAAMEHHLADPETIVPCPGVITIGTRDIPNFNDFSLGNISMKEAFAHSCNTSFADLASKMDSMALTQTAAWLGLGVDYTIPALYSVTGKVLPAPQLIDRTEAGFGQGKDLVSPLGMAIVAASVAHGSLVTPQLVVGERTSINSYPKGTTPGFLAPNTIDKLRDMMRAVVVSGTAQYLRHNGKVYGKTGEAEYGNGSHSWFVGYRGDLAFATLVVSGGGSFAAVQLTSDFLDQLPIQ